ncbi:phage major capsid protein [Arsenicitalea aurantiaca]|uniref:Phage major capsid protein n=1 Tax=Arsenicitalea aurantiaca TaxID=1783274 RepID=A0A433XEU4_9HYPH|nr:phage major capsid protein [Arsenicitalea aurantiaca]RUT32637.1 phage major capsid protein [Arsenicitalea aurantiaca]
MSTDNKSATELAAEIKAEHKQAVDAVKAIAEEALGKAKAGEELTSSLKEKADDALIKMNGLTEQVAELSQKLARADHGGQEGHKSYGEQFIELDELKALKDSPRSGASASMPIKADITTATTNAAGSAGAGIAPNRLPGVLEMPRRRLTVRDLLTPGNTDSPLIQYIQETGFTNNAAPVAEGGLKPQSDLKLTDKDVSTKVIAHWFRASKQILSDFAQIRSMIDGRLLYGLAMVEEGQLLNGDGTGENLHGIIPQATSFAVPTGAVTPTPFTSLDVLRLAMLQAALAEYPATGHVLNPIDWSNIELTKDGEGRYIIANPQGTTQPTLWGLPVVSTQAMAVGKFLTGAFRLGAQIFDQWASRIEVGFQNDDFVRNKVTILAEERLALAVYRPEAFIYGDVAPAVEAPQD